MKYIIEAIQGKLCFLLLCWWRENNENVVVVVEEGKLWKNKEANMGVKKIVVIEIQSWTKVFGKIFIISAFMIVFISNFRNTFGRSLLKNSGSFNAPMQKYGVAYRQNSK